MTLVDRVMASKAGRKEYLRESLFLEVTEAICDLMKKQKINRVQLAKRLGRTKGCITKILNGSRGMSLKTVADIFGALNRSVEIKVVVLDNPKLRAAGKGEGG